MELVQMKHEDGRIARIDPADLQNIEKFKAAGFEFVEQDTPKSPPELPPEKSIPDGGTAGEEMTTEGKEAQDQASGQAEPSPEEAREAEKSAKDRDKKKK